MTDAWLQALLSSLLSGLTVGVVLTVFKNKLDGSANTAKEASALRERTILSEIEKVDKKIGYVDGRTKSLETKFDTMSQSFGKMDMKLAVSLAEQKHTTENLSLLRGQVERVIVQTNQENYGKVTVKP